jgi:hypothetical protein
MAGAGGSWRSISRAAPRPITFDGSESHPLWVPARPRKPKDHSHILDGCGRHSRPPRKTIGIWAAQAVTSMDAKRLRKHYEVTPWSGHCGNMPSVRRSGPLQLR